MPGPVPSLSHSVLVPRPSQDQDTIVRGAELSAGFCPKELAIKVTGTREDVGDSVAAHERGFGTGSAQPRVLYP